MVHTLSSRVWGAHVVKFPEGDLYVFIGSKFIVQGYLSFFDVARKPAGI
jgi:hypothetical protein